MAVSINPDSKVLGVLDLIKEAGSGVHQNPWDNIRDKVGGLLYNTLVEPQEYQTPVFDTGQTQQFADTYNAMLPERGSKQSMLLPFGYDAQGNIEPAIPSLARDVGLGAFGLLGEYEKAQTGTGYQDVRDITGQEAANVSQGMLEVMTGGLLDNAPKTFTSGLKRSGGVLNTDIDDLGFYSPTERLAANLQPKGTGQQYLGILSKGDGQGSRIQEEMADMGLDTWLQGKGKVSRDEVLDYIGENRLRYGKEVLGGNSELLDNSNMRQIDEHLARGGEIYGIAAGGDVVSLTNDVGEVFPYVRGDPAQYYIYKGSFDDAVKRNAEPKYDMYAQEGGTNYQEGLLTVPRQKTPTDLYEDRLTEVQITHNEIGSSGYYDYATPEEIKELDGLLGNIELEDSLKEASPYQSPHYDQANIGLTTRTQSFNTPDGNSVHLMDELQSDWHKEGKKKGYKTPRDKKTFDALTQEKADRIVVKPTSDGQFQGFWTRPEDDWLTTGIRGSTEEEALLNTLGDAHDIRYKNATGVPNAPAKQSWINQGIKHEISNTIESGKDYFAWTGGDIQADRYSLSEHIEGLEVIPSSEDGMVDVLIKPKGQDYQGISDGIIPKEDLHRYVGKEMADKALAHLDATSSYNQADLDAVINSFGDEDIMEAWVEKTPKTATYPNGRWQGRFQHPDVFEGDFQVTGHGTTEQEALEILEKDFRELAKMSFAEPEPFYAEGLDLKVGGEGMKSFYDKDVKKRTEKIIKRLDPKAKVEVIELDNGNKVWGVKITDQMRDKVKGEGMPLYSIAPIAGAGLLGAGMMKQEDQQPQQGILN